MNVSEDKDFGDGDDNVIQRVTADVDLTIVKDATYKFKARDELRILNVSGGDLTILTDAAVDVEGKGLTISDNGYAVFVKRKTGSSNWYSYGDLS